MHDNYIVDGNAITVFFMILSDEIEGWMNADKRS